MCGRFAQYQGIAAYLQALAPHTAILSGYDNLPLDRYNIAPSSRVHVLRGTAQGVRIDAVKWGWSPSWATGKRPAPINARVETVTTSKFFRQLWPHRRALVPSDGWYEWTPDPRDPRRKQPWLIRLKRREPMFFAALAEVHDGPTPDERDGMVIITAASDSGMVDIHDRRPVVLAAAFARQWIDLGVPAAQAEAIVKNHGRPVSDFEWFKVDRAVGNVRNQGPQLIVAIDDTDFGTRESG